MNRISAASFLPNVSSQGGPGAADVPGKPAQNKPAWSALDGPPNWSFMTEREVADLLRVSSRTLERHRLAGTGPPFVKLGRRVVYRRDDIHHWADQNRFLSTSEVEARRG